MTQVEVNPVTVLTTPRLHRDAGGLAHLRFIDALRGIAILGVLLIHAEVATPALTGHVRRLFSYGAYGVQLFFVVSAATLFMSLAERKKTDRKPLLAFFVRRLSRVAPLFWIGAGFYIWHPMPFRNEMVPNGINRCEIAATLLFVHGFHPLTLNSVVPGGWSIADEAIFYCLLPFLFSRVRTLKSALWLLALTTALVGFFSPEATRILHKLCSNLPPFPVDFFATCNFATQLPVFECGIVLSFLVGSDRNGTEESMRPATSTFSLHRFLIFTSIILVFQIVSDQVVAAIGCVLLAFAVFRAPACLIVNRYMIFLGRISFSVYIWHFVVLNLLAPKVVADLHVPLLPAGLNAVLQTTLIVLLVLIATIPIATLSYWLVERTGITLGKKALKSLAWA